MSGTRVSKRGRSILCSLLVIRVKGPGTVAIIRSTHEFFHSSHEVVAAIIVVGIDYPRISVGRLFHNLFDVKLYLIRVWGSNRILPPFTRYGKLHSASSIGST